MAGDPVSVIFQNAVPGGDTAVDVFRRVVAPVRGFVGEGAGDGLSVGAGNGVTGGTQGDETWVARLPLKGDAKFVKTRVGFLWVFRRPRRLDAATRARVRARAATRIAEQPGKKNGGGGKLDGRVSTCVNENKNCKEWAASGECEKNAPYMLASCRRACGVCEADGDDGDGDDAEGEEAETTTDALLHATVALEDEVAEEWWEGGVDPDDLDCEDEDGLKNNCAARARKGHCATYPVSMLTHCKRACKECRVIYVAAPNDVRNYEQVVHVDGPRPKVTFHNRRKNVVRVHWVNSDTGWPTTEPNAIVHPGRSGSVGTYYGHSFAGFDTKTGEEVGRYTVAKDKGGHQQEYTFK